MKNWMFFLVIYFVFSFLTPSTAQTFWAEGQYNIKHTRGDSLNENSHLLHGFYEGKANKNGFSCNFYGLVTNADDGWGEVAILPSWTKETEKLGLFSLSLGVGFETATPKPRFTGSVFYSKGAFEYLFLWEQGTKNNWHLSYITYKLIQHEDGAYYSLGLWSQRDASHGFRVAIGAKEEFEVWLVIGKPNFNFKEKNIGIIAGFKYFL